jgi:hypothetical protein
MSGAGSQNGGPAERVTPQRFAGWVREDSPVRHGNTSIVLTADTYTSAPLVPHDQLCLWRDASLIVCFTG